MFSFFKKTAVDLAIIDSLFPQANPWGFRNFEINGLLRALPDSVAFGMSVMYPDKKAWFSHGYGRTLNQFKRDRASYLTYYPQNKERVRYLPKRMQARLAYTYFLAETYTVLPYLERNKIPFVFVLYPGGAFGLNNTSSDAMLDAVLSSPYFKKVIVTQRVTRQYLLDKHQCPLDKIHYEFGGYVQFFQQDVPPKRYYPSDKSTLDLCFVAAKYSPQGVDKGYDVFIALAKALAMTYDFVRFHVVGNFTVDDVNVDGIADKIVFYGFKDASFLKSFYPNMDICLSPARPYQLYPGNFDGFPLGADALCFGTVLMVTDALHNNDGFVDGEELVMITPDVDDILDKITPLIQDPPKMYALGRAGQAKLYTVMDPHRRLENIVAQLAEKETPCKNL